ncbi:ATP-binding protein [Cryobacterium sp. PH31-L1]|uniref:AAA family ATPase n=1 Tax=Cryobacterium sp. PH31-L1 TaxID=3046199 RepID=UPI0024BA2CC9|nr:ATP-binding protein [Cryobacterium sp. PH31-L1]MDJ0378494.1 AAA family ATPase [Cryobacterium sp. PH31-L1]
MRIKTYNPYKSIVETPIADELPDFTLITGANGSGKTHLLESMREMATQFDGGYGGRMPRMLGTADLQIMDHILASPETREQKVDQLRASVAEQNSRTRGTADHRQMMQNFLVQNGILSAAALSAAELNAGKPLENWTDSDFARFTPLEIGRRDHFSVMVADVFFNYVYLHTLNGYKQWRSAEFGDDVDWIEADDFLRMHGTPPWDLLNRVLEDVGLNYQYETPEPLVMPPYPAPRLVDIGTGLDLPPSELSSGEKTLLTIALSIYSVNNRKNAVEPPSVILLDEPDATLHPSMVRSLLKLVREEIVGNLAVPVIMTTHSPTTVALAEEDSIFVMQRTASPRLRKASKDQALKSLLVGVPALSVRAENRRTVIVESPNDERVYTMAAALISPMIGSERSLQFMAAGSSLLPNGCDAVVDLVTRLRANGNDLVWGFVDRDERSREPGAHVYFDAARHSIENLFLDPLAVGLLLLRDGEPRMVAALGSTNYVSFDRSRAEALVSWLTEKLVQSGDDRTPRSVSYSDNCILDIEAFWLDTRGHNLCDRLLTVFPSLKAHKGRLLDDVVKFVWAEHRWVVPLSTVNTMTRFLED